MKTGSVQSPEPVLTTPEVTGRQRCGLVWTLAHLPGTWGDICNPYVCASSNLPRGHFQDNPATSEAITLEPRKVIVFRLSRKLRGELN